MRHRKFTLKLNRTSSHRDAMFRNMVTSLFKHDRIRTTDTKAKELRRWADHLITLAKRGDLHARRQAMAIIREKAVVHKLFETAAQRFGQVSGGYTRVVKLGVRPGDAAPVSLVELITTQEKPKKKKKPAKGKAKAKTAAAPRKEEVKETPAATAETQSAEPEPAAAAAEEQAPSPKKSKASKTKAADKDKPEAEPVADAKPKTRKTQAGKKKASAAESKPARTRAAKETAAAKKTDKPAEKKPSPKAASKTDEDSEPEVKK